MANLPFATAQQAADIAEIEVTKLGVNAHDFPTKKNLVDSGDFDVDTISGYQDKDFVLLNDVKDGTKYVSVSAFVQSGRTDYATVKVGEGISGPTSSIVVEEGSLVQFSCTIIDPSSASFMGWYNGEELLSSDEIYSVSAIDGLNLEARINYLEVSPESLDIDSSGDAQEVTIDTNESWTVE